MKNKWVNRGLLLFFALLLAITSLLAPQKASESDRISHEVAHLQDDFSEIEKTITIEVEKLVGLSQEVDYADHFQTQETHYEKLADKGVALFLFQGGVLKYWTTNRFPIATPTVKSGFNQKAGGFYYHVVKVQGDQMVVGQLLIKRAFPFENSQIQNTFNPVFNLEEHWKLSLTDLQEGSFIQDEGRNFKLCLKPGFLFEPKTEKLLSALELISFIGLFILLIRFIRTQSNLVRNVAALIVLPLIRWGLIWLQFPFNLYGLELFSPEVMAVSDFIPSLGDLLLHNVFILALVLILPLEQITFSKIGFRGKVLLVGTFLVVIYLGAWAAMETIEALVLHSQIPLDLSNILNVGFYSLMALLSISLIFLTFFYINKSFVQLLRRSGISIKFFFVYVLIFFTCTSFGGLFLGGEDAVKLLWCFPFVLLTGYAVFLRSGKFDFSIVVALLFIQSLFVTQTLRNYEQQKESLEEDQLLQILSQEKDPIGEFLFTEILASMQKDQVLLNWFATWNQEESEINAHIQQKWFKGYWQKFDIQCTSCGAEDSLVLPNGEERKCFDFFQSKIETFGSETSPYFYFLDNHTGRISYLGVVNFGKEGKLFIELDSKFKPENAGFPSLLLDKKIVRKSIPQNYAYAHYRSNRLEKSKGGFGFPQEPTIFESSDSTKSQIEYLGFDHAVLNLGEDIFVLSKPHVGIWNEMAFYSYLFAFFSVLTILIFGLPVLFKQFKVIRTSFVYRFRAIIIAILFISTFVIGLSSVYYLRHQYNQKNFDAISEKIKSVSIELEHKFGDSEAVDSVNLNWVQSILEKYSVVFFTDINLYDLNGALLASSQPKVFKEGLLGNRMHPKAMHALLFQQQSRFVQIEEIEGMQYLSAYVPFFNKNGQQLAYLNLPYFARTNDIKNEISSFLVALLNIYALLIVLALVVAIFVTNRITEPLKIISEKMAHVRLGGANELINWDGKDEIGKLVQEYNRMIVELTESATQLAKSEREGAWRQMAQQVAHEIKNPLTPMKLSIQHLSMRWSSMDIEERNERFQSFSKNLLEQIETLSAIATEFSNFAKLEQAHFSAVDLVKLAESSVDVYNGSSGVEVTLSAPESVIIQADKNQMVRVLNNLIKNACQAKSDGPNSWVKVNIETHDKHVLLTIQDNGRGIPKAIQSRVFEPNFTTKSSGMGLGLAMVQKIIQNMNGTIEFKTKEGEGTTFIIQLFLAA